MCEGDLRPPGTLAPPPTRRIGPPRDTKKDIIGQKLTDEANAIKCSDIENSVAESEVVEEVR